MSGVRAVVRCDRCFFWEKSATLTLSGETRGKCYYEPGAEWMRGEEFCSHWMSEDGQVSLYGVLQNMRKEPAGG